MQKFYRGHRSEIFFRFKFTACGKNTSYRFFEKLKNIITCVK